MASNRPSGFNPKGNDTMHHFWPMRRQITHRRFWILTLLLPMTLLPMTVHGDGPPTNGTPADATTPDATTPPGIESLAWMAGCWASEGAEPGSGEQWTASAGGTMFGVSRTLSDGKTVFYEFMILRQTEPSGLELVALPLGRSETAFQMIEWGETSAVFENPENDFPQRIRYWLADADHLKARIEGEVDGKLETGDFAMVGTDCP